MKKLLLILFMFVLGMSGIYAQSSATATKKTAKTSTATEKKGTKLKADGTPDMRYKENKAKAKPAGPTKKDGTADMRYKANKTGK